MTRTPDEIKKGLECCVDGNIKCDGNCVFDDDIEMFPNCIKLLMANALALIQQLEAQNAEKDERIKQLEKRVIHLEALNQSNLSVITMQERTRDRLQEQISQLEAERDALIDAVKDWGGACATCEHYSNEPDEIPCRFCIEMHPEDEDRISHWKWRGVQKEETK